MFSSQSASFPVTLSNSGKPRNDVLAKVLRNVIARGKKPRCNFARKMRNPIQRKCIPWAKSKLAPVEGREETTAQTFPFISRDF
jgi:hypothetical protein